MTGHSALTRQLIQDGLRRPSCPTTPLIVLVHPNGSRQEIAIQEGVHVITLIRRGNVLSADHQHQGD